MDKQIVAYINNEFIINGKNTVNTPFKYKKMCIFAPKVGWKMCFISWGYNIGKNEQLLTLPMYMAFLLTEV